MKRDYELIKKIMFQLEEKSNIEEDELSFEDFDLPGVTEEAFYTQTALMFRDGLINAKKEVYISYRYPKYKPVYIEQPGYEFLNAAKNDTPWEKAMKYILEKGKEVSLIDLIKLLRGFITGI
ncbi:MAG: DUF2513 domain-containing protein [Chloroflexi bacterium]|nr:DUF2513 domain-containing protein [Chloroflexota bacterium]